VWGGLWCIANGAWAWVGVVTGVVVIELATSLYVRSLGAPLVLSIAAAVTNRALWFAVVIYFAYHANRHVWEHERRRVAAQSDQSVPRPALTILEFEANERRWFWVGLVFLGLTTVWGLWLSRSPARLWPDVASDLTMLVILGGLFVFETLRTRESPGRS
jgi:hypothetical protein